MAAPAALIGEFVAMRLRPKSVLVVGGGGDADSVVAELTDRGLDAIGSGIGVPVVQFARRFDLVVLLESVFAGGDAELRRAMVHGVAQHLEPAAAVVSQFDAATVTEFDSLCSDCELHLESRSDGWDCGARACSTGSPVVSVHRRTARFNVHDLLFEARSTIQRVTPEVLMRRLDTGNAPLVVDIRTPTDREAVGAIAGSIHVPRTVVEWHLDAANGYRHPAAPTFDQAIVVVCNDGYSSSLSAANLVRIGFADVADLIGGMTAWLRAGLPTVPVRSPSTG